MTLQEYIRLAVRTEVSTATLLTRWDDIMQLVTDPNPVRLLHAQAGFASEWGELKYETHTPEALREELGDVCWYAAIVYDELGRYHEISSTYAASDVQARLTATAAVYLEFPSTETATDVLSCYRHVADDIIKAYAFYDRTIYKCPVSGLEYPALPLLLSLTDCLMKAFWNEDQLTQNIDKLRRRYPERFTEVAANARMDKQESEPEDI